MKNLYKILLVLCFLPMNANCNTSTQQEQIIIGSLKEKIKNAFNDARVPYEQAPDQQHQQITAEEESELTQEQKPQDAAEQQTTTKEGSELTQEQKLQKVAELHENYEDMKEIENSFENRLLGATGSATMGIGGMQLATSLSEDKADDAAEQQMKAYLETFRCNYSNGKNIKGGETNIELPGGNELINLYSEYVGLANDLKTRKNALGMRTGIESEPILDSATSGLYDDVSVGKTSGVFTSLARALSDPNSEDAAAWAAQREETAQKKKTALTTIGIGAVATVAGNLLINYNNEEERSAEIIQKYENLKLGLDNIATEINNTASQKLNTKAKNCTGNKYYSGNSGECIECAKNQKVNATKNGCECINEGEIINKNGECTNSCELTGILSDGECSCANNAIEQNGECISISKNFGTVISEFSADNAFDLGKKTLTEPAKKAIQDNKNKIEQALKSYENKTYCLYITGHTDRTGWKDCKGNNKCNNEKNKEISKSRADAVLTELELNGNNNVRAKGAGSEKCDETTYPEKNNSKCRKITFEITEESC